MATRDEFPAKVVLVLRERVNSVCSNPDCRCSTTGPNEIASEVTRIGTAAHICAASPGGPRFDPLMTPAERSSVLNGIWLCAVCARRIDADWRRYSRELLLAWKSEAESEANRQLGKPKSTRQEEQIRQHEAEFVCPHCNTGFMRAQTVCKGCLGQIVQGQTREERAATKMTGFMISGLPLLFIYQKFDINLVPLGSGPIAYIPLFILLISSLCTGYLAVSFEEKRRRKSNPRVFVRTYV